MRKRELKCLLVEQSLSLLLLLDSSERIWAKYLWLWQPPSAPIPGCIEGRYYQDDALEGYLYLNQQDGLWSPPPAVILEGSIFIHSFLLCFQLNTAYLPVLVVIRDPN